MNNILPDCLSNDLRGKGLYLEPLLHVKQFAWSYRDVKLVLKALTDNGYIILGGDVMKKDNDNLDYAIAFWSYDEDKSKSKKENIGISLNKASQYIDNFYETHDDNYFYVVVYEKL